MSILDYLGLKGDHNSIYVTDIILNYVPRVYSFFSMDIKLGRPLVFVV